MIVFELLINGELVASGGSPDLSVLSQTITAVGVLGPDSRGTQSVSEGFQLQASLTGLASPRTATEHHHLGWHKSELKVGDELTIRISERPKADTPQVIGERED